MMKNRIFIGLMRLGLVGGAFGMLVSCENANEISRLNDSISGREEILADVEERIAKEEVSLAKFAELKDIEDRFNAATKKLEELEAQLETEKSLTSEATAAVKTASLKFINYRNQYRRNERSKAKGTLIDLSATKGSEYKDVRITRITPLELRVLLQSGPKGVPYNQLPADIQERFQFSEEEAIAYENAVAKVRLANSKANRVVDADKQVEQATVQATEVAAAIAEKRSLIASITRRIRSKQLEAERLESLSRHWRTEENNSRAQGRSGAARSRAVKISDQANQIRLGISNAKEMILQLRHDIGQLRKRS